MTDPVCEHCGGALTRRSGTRVKLLVKSRIVAFDTAGAEMVCPHCRKDTRLPLYLGELPPSKPAVRSPGRIIIGSGVVRRRAE